MTGEFFARVLSLDRRVFSRMLFTCPGSFEQDAFHLTGEFITRGGLSLDRYLARGFSLVWGVFSTDICHLSGNSTIGGL